MVGSFVGAAIDATAGATGSGAFELAAGAGVAGPVSIGELATAAFFGATLAVAGLAATAFAGSFFSFTAVGAAFAGEAFCAAVFAAVGLVAGLVAGDLMDAGGALLASAVSAASSPVIGSATFLAVGLVALVAAGALGFASGLAVAGTAFLVDGFFAAGFSIAGVLETDDSGVGGAISGVKSSGVVMAKTPSY